MANPDHLAVLKFGSSDWNEWRSRHPEVVPDLSRAHFREGHFSCAHLAGADLSLAYFGRADLTGSDLTGANLSEASLRGANFSNANMTNATLIGADLSGADFSGARLVSANISQAYLGRANLAGANLEGASLAGSDLRLASAVDSNFRGADLTGCMVYGIAAWNTNLDDAKQQDLVITKSDEHMVTTDSLQVAQFVYLLLNNRTIRDVIETVGKKAILILGRFSDERKLILNLLRSALRSTGLVPILFDFAGPSNRDITETVSTLAHLAKAVIVDVTDASGVPQELMAIVPTLPSVPILPIVASSSSVYAMFEHFRRFPWVHPIFRYAGEDDLLCWLRETLAAIV